MSPRPCSPRGQGRGRRPWPSSANLSLAAAVAVELVGDKLPFTPSRLDPPGPVVRVGSGAVGGWLLAGGSSPATRFAALGAGAVGGALGTWSGAAWRRVVGRGRPDWPGAVVEDVVALGLAVWSCRSLPDREPSR